MPGAWDCMCRCTTDYLIPGGEAGVRLFRELKHSKAALYIGEFRNLWHMPRQGACSKIPEKTLSFHLRIIPTFRTNLAKFWRIVVEQTQSAKTGEFLAFKEIFWKTFSELHRDFSDHTWQGTVFGYNKVAWRSLQQMDHCSIQQLKKK